MTLQSAIENPPVQPQVLTAQAAVPGQAAPAQATPVLTQAHLLKDVDVLRKSNSSSSVLSNVSVLSSISPVVFKPTHSCKAFLAPSSKVVLERIQIIHGFYVGVNLDIFKELQQELNLLKQTAKK